MFDVIQANSFQNKQRELSYNHMRKRYAAARNEVLKCYKIIDAYKREFAQLKMRVGRIQLNYLKINLILIN